MINILIAIIINSLEEVHAAERENDRRERLASLDASDDDAVPISARLAALRGAIDDLERDLETTAERPGRTPARRPTRGGRMRG